MARNTLIVSVLLAGLVAIPAQAAKLYKWVDKQGNVSYQDRPPPEGQGQVEERTVRDRRGAASDTASDSRAPVTLYAVPGCAPCEQARAYLNKRGVAFAEIDVSAKNPQAQQDMIKKVGQLSVPTITVGSKVMQGYVESLLEGELVQAGHPKPEAEPEAESAPAQ